MADSVIEQAAKKGVSIEDSSRAAPAILLRVFHLNLSAPVQWASTAGVTVDANKLASHEAAFAKMASSSAKVSVRVKHEWR